MHIVSSSFTGNAAPDGTVRRPLTAETAYVLAGRLAPWFAWCAGGLCAFGLYFGFFVSPTDLHQGDHYRIAFIQRPSLWLSVVVYIFMAGTSAYGLLANHRLASMLASAVAPTGAMFAFLALWTGSLWGKPMWGSWWIWDAQLSTELLVLFLFLGFIALHEAIDDARRADRAAGVLALVGIVGLPLLYFSVSRWSHSYGTHSRGLATPTDIDAAVWMALLSMSLGFLAYTGATALTRLRNEILTRERSSDWVSARIEGRV